MWPNFRSMKFERSIILAESNYFPSSGVWLLFQNMISFWVAVPGSIFVLNLSQLIRTNAISFIKKCQLPRHALNNQTYACCTNEGTGLNGERFSRTYICPWYSQTSPVCFCFVRQSNIIRRMYHQMSHTLNTQRNANIYVLFCKCKGHRKLYLQLKFISTHI